MKHAIPSALGPAILGLLMVSCAPTHSSGHRFLSDYGKLKQRSAISDRVSYEGGLSKIPGYKKVFLEDVRVFPPKDMAKKNITSEDLKRTEGMFRQALRDEVRNSSFSLASGPGADTLSIRAAVVDLKPGNPAIFAATYAPYVGSASTALSVVQGENIGAGSATIEAEILDSTSRDQLLAVVDKNAGNKLQVVEGMTRWGHIEAALKEWAKDFRLALKGEISSHDF